MSEDPYNSDVVLIQAVRTEAEGTDEAQKAIFGLTILSSELFVVHQFSQEVKVYDSTKFTLIRKWKLEELINSVDMASCSRNRCLYIMDCKGMGRSNEILRVDPNGNLIQKWRTSRNYGRLSITAESNVVLTVSKKHKIYVYSDSGELIKEIELSGLGISDPWHAVKLTSGHFVVSYGYEADDVHGVCVVDAVGKVLKSFGGKRGSGDGQLSQPINLAVDGDGFVIVADLNNSRVILLDSDLQFRRVILSKEKHGLHNPERICLCGDVLFVADNELDHIKGIWRNGRVLIYCLK